MDLSKLIGRDVDMKIKKRKISELQDAEYNPRTLTDKQFEDLRQSMQKFGSVEPAIVNVNPDRKNVIVSGHQRIKVAKKLGYKEFPCIELQLDLSDERELNIRMNKNTGEWNFDALANNFDIEELKGFGFSDSDLKLGPSSQEVNFTVDPGKKTTCPECGHEW